MNNIKKSGEDYLEAILFLECKNRIVRSVDIAKRLNVSRPSVNKAINNLKERGYISKEHYGNIMLTDEGRKLDENVQSRDSILSTFLTQILGVDEQIAEIDACKMEHDISDETIEKLKSFIDTIKK